MILKAVNSRLQSSLELQDIVGEKIYPVFIPESVEAPAVAFNAVTLPSQSKSAKTMSKNNVEIVALAKNYNQLAEIGRIIELLFTQFSLTIDNERVLGSSVTSLLRSYDPKYKEYEIIITIEIDSKIV